MVFRFGFKLWGICNKLGWLIHAEPYCGKSARIGDIGLGQGPIVVMGLVDHADVSPGDHLFFDNLFTSVPLLEKLSEKGIGGTGTMRQNRLGPIPIQKKKEVEKEWERGDYTDIYHADFTVSVWKDNKPVYMGSNVHEVEPTHPVTRYSREQKKRITVGKYIVYLATLFIFL